MFFVKNKKIEDTLQKLAENSEKLSRQLSDNQSQFETMKQHMKQFQTALSKHDMEIEDLLEEWGDKRSETDLSQEHLRNLMRNETLLLQLFGAYQEQFFSLKRFAATKDEAWSQQLTLMEQQLVHFRQLCGIHVIESESIGTKVDYDFHEVIEVLPSPDTQSDNTIAAVYRSGYVYRGIVKQKAHVAAYRSAGQESVTLSPSNT